MIAQKEYIEILWWKGFFFQLKIFDVEIIAVLSAFPMNNTKGSYLPQFSFLQW